MPGQVVRLAGGTHEGEEREADQPAAICARCDSQVTHWHGARGLGFPLTPRLRMRGFLGLAIFCLK